MSTTVKSKSWFLNRAALAGLYVTTWSPGDGKTRYRFHVAPGDYHDGSDVGFALGLSEAIAWLDGWLAAKSHADFEATR